MLHKQTHTELQIYIPKRNSRLRSSQNKFFHGVLLTHKRTGNLYDKIFSNKVHGGD